MIIPNPMTPRTGREFSIERKFNVLKVIVKDERGKHWWREYTEPTQASLTRVQRVIYAAPRHDTVHPSSNHVAFFGYYPPTQEPRQ